MARVLLFGRLADVAGWRERVIEAATLGELKQMLSRSDPGLGEALAAGGVQAAVDKVIARGATTLTPTSEVAFMPAMSGG